MLSLADSIVSYLRLIGGVSNLSQADLIAQFGPLPTAEELLALGYTHSYNDNLSEYLATFGGSTIFLVDLSGNLLVDLNGDFLTKA